MDTLVGRTVVRVEGLHEGSTSVQFHFEDGTRMEMYHEQDCCEAVSLCDVVGGPEQLLGVPLLQAREDRSLDATDPEAYDSHTWTYYTFATIKGYVHLRWLGSSNGYYSESVDVYHRI